MKRPVHYEPDLAAGNARRRSLCGLTWEAGMMFAASPAEVTCRRVACARSSRAEIARLEALRLRAVGATVLFLDFDGVLNHTAFFEARRAERARVRVVDRDPIEALSFDRACVDRLNRFLVQTSALVVVSSAWRLGSTVRRLQKLIDRHGFAGTVIGQTPDLSWRPVPPEQRQRGHEIRAWLDALPVPPRAFVVLDDDSDMDAVRDHFVKTDFSGGGLTDAKVDEALAVLERQAREPA